MIDLKPLLVEIAKQYTLDPAGAHGLNHWGRVLENGTRLAEIEGGDVSVVRLFAIFHDACRRNQTLDPGHGERGAKLAESLLGDLVLISKEQLDLLLFACREHTDGKTIADLTIQICWDADRLDLGRVPITPNPKHLCTAAAKSRTMIQWANQRAKNDHAPGFVTSAWNRIFDPV